MLNIRTQLRCSNRLLFRQLHNCTRHPCMYQRSKQAARALDRLRPVYLEKCDETVLCSVVAVVSAVGAVMAANYDVPFLCFFNGFMFAHFAPAAFQCFDELETLQKEIKQLEKHV